MLSYLAFCRDWDVQPRACAPYRARTKGKVRYSVPYQLVRDHVDIGIDEQTVRIFHGTALVATHVRSREPFARVVEPAHLAGLWRVTTPREPVDATLSALGRSLAEYAAVVR